ncbi:MAG TPA: hypothetical protein VLC47_07225 [Burkholderiales bacterium]|nr:hypothetical protein [Burkholderiales bacterium]
MQALIHPRFMLGAALTAIGGALAAAGTAHAGGTAVGRSATAAPVHAPQHRMTPHPVVVHPGSPALAATIIQPGIPPVFFNPIVPGFVTFVPPVAIVTPVPVPHHHAPYPAPLPAVASVQPSVPAIAPSSPLFFAPPVQTVASPASGQVLVIRRSGH